MDHQRARPRRPAAIGRVRSTAPMAVMDPCERCGRDTPIYRLSAVILDGRIARVCPRCAAEAGDRIALPYAPRPDNGAIQPSTSRDIW